MKNKKAWIIGGVVVAGILIWRYRQNAAAQAATTVATAPLPATNPATNTGIVPPLTPASSSGIKLKPAVQPINTIMKPTLKQAVSGLGNLYL